MSKINLVIATNILDIGGAERTVQTLALRLDKSKFDVTVLCLVRGGPRVKLLEEHGARVLVGDGTIEKIKELLPHPQVDVLHFHRSGQNELPIHKEVVEYLQPKKCMETNIFAFEDEVLSSRFDLRLYKSMMMLAERAWKGEQKTVEDCLRQRVAYNPVTVDYFEQFRLSSEKREAMRRELGIMSEEIVIGRVGRNDTVKWGDLILSSLPLLFKKNSNIKVLFRTVPTSRLRWLQKKSFFGGRVIVLPESSSEKDIAETYQLMDICVHTSRRGEAFGNSLNEAMVWSLPIVVENTPHWDNGQLEQVDNGVTGWVVKTVGGLSSAVHDLAANHTRRKEFGSAGRHKVIAEFAVERGVAQYELAYEQLHGKVGEAEVLKKMFPTPEAITAYHTAYTDRKALDFPHQASLLYEIYRWYVYGRFRILDSLVARGLWRLQK